MEFENVTFIGPEIEDEELLSQLLNEMSSLLRQINGFIQFGGGFHLRGVCQKPLWHSLHYVWQGEGALWKSYPKLLVDDVPFAQDALGDQFILRGGEVHRLNSETGDLETLDCDFSAFLRNVQSNFVEYLQLQPFVQFLNDGGNLEAGQLLSVYPPFCVAHNNEYSYRAIAALDRLSFLASFSRQIANLDDGTSIQFKVK